MIKRYIVTILLLVAAVMLLAACSSSSGDAPEEVPVEEIQDITWEWTELIENNPAAQSVVPDPENYTLTFFADGTVAMKVDCNSGNGSYTVDGNKIEFYVDGVLTGTPVLTNIPTTEYMTPTIAYLTGEAAAHTMTVSWMRAFQLS